MITENLSTLKINKLSEEQYKRAYAAGRIDPTALYLTPDEYKHKTEEEWNATPEFIPEAGEIIVYDADINHSVPRLKVGDGVQTINQLPFTDEEILSKLDEFQPISVTEKEEGHLVFQGVYQENNANHTGEWECIEKICFGYELLTEKPDDWDTNKESYFWISNYTYKPEHAYSWDAFEPNKFWRYTGNLEPNISGIIRTAEPDGTPYNFKCLIVFGHITNTTGSGLWCFSAWPSGDNSNRIDAVATLPQGSVNYHHHFAYKLTQEYGVYNLLSFSGSQGGGTTVGGVSNADTNSMLKPVSIGNIIKLDAHIYAAKEYHTEGDYIEIWGVRA